MRKRATSAWIPVCLVATLGCQGRYVLGDVQASHAGSASSSNQPMNNAPGGSGNDDTPGAGGRDGAGIAGADTVGSSSGSGALGPQFACQAVASQQFDASSMRAYVVSPDVSNAVNAALLKMSAVDKTSQMLGVPVGDMDYQDVERSPDISVPGLGTIRGYRYRDGDRGLNLDAGQDNRSSDGNDFATVFPTTSIRSASWDLELERRVGEAIGDETAASRNNLLLAPGMDIVRHPYWGRTQETYGEDSYQIGRMATAFTVGLQEYVTGCANHFAANNIEMRRSTQNALMNEQTLREIYLRHFEMVVQDAGVGCFVASINAINGVKNTQNQHLLRDILKAPISQGGMGFQGFVVSDWWAMPGDNTPLDPQLAQSQTRDAVDAGLDVEMPWTLHYTTASLTANGVEPALVADSARRVLTQKYRFKTALVTDGWSLKPPTSTLTGGSITPNTDHEALAEEVELKSAVLLTNGTSDAAVLPLTNAAKNIAVVGPDREFTLFSSTVPKSCEVNPDNPRYCNFHFATDPALGDRGSSRVNGDPTRSVGPFAGIQAAAGSSRQVTSGNSADAAANADAVVVVVGYSPGDEGEEYTIAEGGDRTTLDLPPGQSEFVMSVLDLMKPTVIIVETGSIVNLPWLAHANKNQATVWAGYGGLRGGAALGKLIFGAANFSGKLPMAWPTQAELEMMPFKTSDTSTTMGYFFGYREYDRRKALGRSVSLVFPFGHGLSYSHFEYSNLTVPCQNAAPDAVFAVSVDIKNTSTVDGDEIAMLFVKPPPKPPGLTGDRPVRELKSFARVALMAGQSATVQLPLRIRDLRRWEGGENGKWLIDSGSYTLSVGKNADDAETSSLQGTFTVQGN
ncbi:MAG TPA: glycoside hydrolase family 3 C-terminal domain-containing protein [Polyangiaceae bacterium]